MPRVAPAEYNDPEKNAPETHRHTPNASHFADVVADGADQQVLADFEKYTIKSSDEEEHHPKAHIKTNKRFSEDQRLTIERGQSTVVDPRPSKAGKFLQCDLLTAILILLYITCVCLAIIAYEDFESDTNWNRIVHNKRPFPKIENENFFGGQHLFIPEHDKGLRRAKNNLLREDRWFDLVYLMYMSAYLILTLFQIAAFITRGNEDHTRFMDSYYTVFALFGLIAAWFPLISRRHQDDKYIVAAHYLNDFSRRQWNLTRDKWVPGLTNATAHDAWTLGKIMIFCYDNSQEGFFYNSYKYIQMFGKQYGIRDLQQLGFCTRHRNKTMLTIFTVIFAVQCFLTSCTVYKKQRNRRKRAHKKPATKTQKNSPKQQQPPPKKAQQQPPPKKAQQQPPPKKAQQQPPPKEAQQQPPPVEAQQRPRSGSRERRRSVEKERGFDQVDRSQKQINEVNKWKHYVEGDSN